MHIRKLFFLVFIISISYAYGQINIEKINNIDNNDLNDLFGFGGIQYGKFRISDFKGNLSVKLYEVYDNSTENSELILENYRVSESTDLDIFLIAQIKMKENIINTSFKLGNRKIRNSYSIGESDFSEFNLEGFDNLKLKNRNYIVLTYQSDLKITGTPFGMFYVEPKEQESLKKLIENSNMRFYIYEIVLNK